MNEGTNFQTARLIWLALLAGVGVHLLVFDTLAPQIATPPVETGVLPFAFLVLTLANAAGALFLHRTTASVAHVREHVQRLVVCWALDEAVAVYGLVIGLVTRQRATPFFLFATAVVLLLVMRPQRDQFERFR